MAFGITYHIYRGINTNNASLIIVGSIAVALLALLADLSIGAIENSLKIKPSLSKKKSSSKKYFAILIFVGIAVALFISVFDMDSKQSVTVASKPTAEQYVLGEIVSQIIENNTDIRVIRKFGIGGGTSNIHPAMLNGEIDMYAEYTGTSWLFVLKKDPITNPDSLYVAFMYTHAAKTAGWFDEVTLVIWGPSARLAAENLKIQEKLKAMQKDGVIIEACIVCASSYGVDEDLKSLEFDVKGMGKPLTDYMKSGAKVLTF